MPKLDSPMHIRMLQTARTAGQIERDGIYGLQWGDPQAHPALGWVRDHYLLPYVNPDHSAVEIGPGGGRWTRYLLGFGQLCTVDYHQELLDELQRSYRAPHLSTLRNNGPTFQVSPMPASILCSRSASSSTSILMLSRLISAASTAS
jgi:hypothetical protein